MTINALIVTIAIFFIDGGANCNAFQINSHVFKQPSKETNNENLIQYKYHLSARMRNGWKATRHENDRDIYKEKINDDIQNSKMRTRRNALKCSARVMAQSISASIITVPNPTMANDGPPNITRVPISASWKAVDGLNSSSNTNNRFVSFDPSAYAAMRDDKTRTPYFEKAILERISSNKDMVVLDLGTGPYALFALIAARAGAKKVYAIEADPEAAKSAREYVEKAGWSNVVTILEGFSTNVELEEKVDLVVAEVAGSVVSEEGAYATILDASRRLVKDPSNPDCWIPNRMQTYAAPASYGLHTLFGPPEFDWDKLKGEPVRFNCRDEGLQLLSDPLLVEDLTFYNIEDTKNNVVKEQLDFVISGERMEDNTIAFYEEYRRGKLSQNDAENMAAIAGNSFSGIAFWPRLVLTNGDGNNEPIVVNSRRYPDGLQQKSHWQTVLPVMSSRPIGPLQDGDKIEVQTKFQIPDQVLFTPQYGLAGYVYLQKGLRSIS